MYYELIYNSISKDGIEESEILDILKTSKEYNEKHNITGCLLYYNAEFLQILEGDKKQVLKLYEKIARDKRHDSVFLIEECEVDTRLFTNWSMAFKALKSEDIQLIGSYKNLNEFTSLIDNAERESIAKKLFYHMSKSILV